MTSTPKQQVVQVVADLSETIDEAILHSLDTGVSDRVLASLAEARGGIVKMQHVMAIVVIDFPHDEPRQYADELPKIKPLPKSTQNAKALPRVGLNLKSPRDYVCPTCGAEVGTMCFKYDRKGVNARRLDERHPAGNYSHVSRQRLSKEYNTKAKRDYDRKHGVT